MKLGLIGKSLIHSFSQGYFKKKFESLGLSDYSYHNFELQQIEDLPELLRSHPDLRGLNVTIPYKETVIPYLTSIDPDAREIGAINTIRVEGNQLIGYNTDFIAFCESLEPLIRKRLPRALILGSGGASKAVAFALKKLDIPFKLVSRTPHNGALSYNEASDVLNDFHLVINTTPVGSFPDIQQMPALRLDNLSENHLFYDLIYNPPVTKWLAKAELEGARIKNGKEMLMRQAEHAWEIWHRD